MTTIARWSGVAGPALGPGLPVVEGPRPDRAGRNTAVVPSIRLAGEIAPLVTRYHRGTDT